MQAKILIKALLPLALGVTNFTQVKEKDALELLYHAKDQLNLLSLNDTGLHWHVQLECGSCETVNVMLSDGYQAKSYRLDSRRKIDLYPVRKLTSTSTLSVLLQTRSVEVISVMVNVTIGSWEDQNEISEQNFLEEFIKKPEPSASSINYFYYYKAAQWGNESSYFPTITEYMLINVKQSHPSSCYLVSLQQATEMVVDNEALIRRLACKLHQ